MKIAIAGIGPVGQALSLLFARTYSVVAFDISKERVEYINNKAFLQDESLKDHIKKNELDLTATISPKEAYSNADVVIIATPTDYNEDERRFDTTSITKTIDLIGQYNTHAIIVIKSTVPVGFMDSICKKNKRLIFCPEFIREDTNLYDCLYPSRIVIGFDLNDNQSFNDAMTIAHILKTSLCKDDIPLLYVSFREAESIKLFSNAYLAMRIGFFNELDTFSEVNGLNTRRIIEGVCLDSRIGMYYNNPGFGFGGYCLPKDTKQLISDYNGIPQALIGSIEEANLIRKKYIVNQILSKISNTNQAVIGIYRLITKANSKSIRYNSVQYIIAELVAKGMSIIIYEPSLKNEFDYYGGTVINNLAEFKTKSDFIIANRFDVQIEDVSYKTYTRDVFGRD